MRKSVESSGAFYLQDPMSFWPPNYKPGKQKEQVVLWPGLFASLALGRQCAGSRSCSDGPDRGAGIRRKLSAQGWPQRQGQGPGKGGRDIMLKLLWNYVFGVFFIMELG